MSTNHTTNYNLCQWEPEDPVLRTDFNEDNAKLEAALLNHDRRLYGVSALGRNLYNLLLRQKRAGQDISWLKNLVFDDFTDQSKIASLGEGMVYSSANKRVTLTPTADRTESVLLTKEFDIEVSTTKLTLAWLRYTLAIEPVVEVWNTFVDKWSTMDQGETNVAALDLNGETCFETAYHIPKYFLYNRKLKLRITLRSTLNMQTSLLDYGVLVC